MLTLEGVFEIVYGYTLQVGKMKSQGLKKNAQSYPGAPFHLPSYPTPWPRSKHSCLSAHFPHHSWAKTTPRCLLTPALESPLLFPICWLCRPNNDCKCLRHRSLFFIPPSPQIPLGSMTGLIIPFIYLFLKRNLQITKVITIGTVFYRLFQVARAKATNCAFLVNGGLLWGQQDAVSAAARRARPTGDSSQPAIVQDEPVAPAAALLTSVLTLSVPRVLHLQSGEDDNNNNTYLIGLLWGLTRLTCVRPLRGWLGHSKC